VFFTGIVKIVQKLQATVAEYDNRLRALHLVTKLSYVRSLLRKDGAPNRMFLTCIIRQELAVQFGSGRNNSSTSYAVDKPHQIEMQCSDHTVAEWVMFCKETMLEFLKERLAR
jgi:hypothetical protein